METWNQRLKQAVSDKGLSPNAFAKSIGVAAPTVSAWLGNGNIQPAKDIKAEHLLKACESLGVRPEWVLWKKGRKEKEEAPGLTAAPRINEALVYPNILENPNALQITQELVDQFISELSVAVSEGRLTGHRFILLRELLREGATAPDTLENQKMTTRGAHGRQKIHRQKAGAE